MFSIMRISKVPEAAEVYLGTGSKNTQDFSVVTWNVNSVAARLPALLNIFQDLSPDFVLLQEIKCKDEAFPVEEISKFGYKSFVHGEKSYNGVAILAKDTHTCTLHQKEFGFADSASRYIEINAQISGSDRNFSIASVYAPNGTSLESPRFTYKLDFLSHLRSYLEEMRALERPLIIGGDFNVARDYKDIPSAVASKERLCFSVEERMALRRIFDVGLYDCFRLVDGVSESYTWWDYRAGAFERNSGLRIDYILASGDLCQNLLTCLHYKKHREIDTRPSDHIPVVATYSF